MCIVLMEQKKKRAPNFSNTEKERVIALVGKYRNIVENKKTDSVNVSAKNEAWFKITQEFNSLAPNNVFRTTESLKKFWDNAKEDLRKRAGDEKRSLYKTAGGPPSPKGKPEDELLREIVNMKTIIGLTNPYDNDCNTIDKTLLDETQFSGNDKNIEIVYEESEMDKIESFPRPSRNDRMTQASVLCNISDDKENHNWAIGETNPEQLKKPLSSSLKRNISEVTGDQRKTIKSKKNMSNTRRRPTAIRVLSSSILAEKYEILIDKKIELADCLKKEHELRMTLLKFDLAMKKKEMESVGFTNLDIQLLDTCDINL